MIKPERDQRPTSTDDLKKIVAGNIADYAKMEHNLEEILYSDDPTQLAILDYKLKIKKGKLEEVKEINRTLSIELMSKKMEKDGIEMHPYVKIRDIKIVPASRVYQVNE